MQRTTTPPWENEKKTRFLRNSTNASTIPLGQRLGETCRWRVSTGLTLLLQEFSAQAIHDGVRLYLIQNGLNYRIRAQWPPGAALF